MKTPCHCAFGATVLAAVLAGCSNGTATSTSVLQPESAEEAQQRRAFVALAQDPIASTGYAKNTSDITRGGVTFSTEGTLFKVSGTNEALESPFTLRMDQDGGSVTIEFDGNKINLPRVGQLEQFEGVGGGRTYILNENTELDEFGTIDGKSFAKILSLYINFDQSNFQDASTGIIPIGFNTDPNIVFDRTGKASYQGRSTAVLRQGAAVGAGSGDVSWDVDFQDNTISGSIKLQDSNLAGNFLVFPSILMTLNETSIEGNSFTGTQTLDVTQMNGARLDFTVEEKQLIGQFFGPNGEVIGGSFILTGANLNGADYTINGGYLSK